MQVLDQNSLLIISVIDPSRELLLLILGLILLALIAIAIFIIRKDDYLKFYFPMEKGSVLKSRNQELQDKISASEENIESITKDFFKEAEEVKEKQDSYQKMNSQLRELSSRLHKIREEERTRIAREIHDELGQQLTAIKIDLSWLNKKLISVDPEIKEKINSLLKLVDSTVQTVRKIATDLRPGILDDLGLLAALEWQCSEFKKRTGIHCNFISSIDDVEFNRDFSTTVFRIFQETLTNIARHSGATRVDIRLELVDNRLFLEVKDNGTGISEQEINNSSSLGLLGMKERAHIFGGEVQITGNKDKGTSVKLQVPLPVKGKNVLTEYS